MRPPVESVGASQLDYVASPLELMLQAPAGSIGVKAGRPLIKLQPYNGSRSMDTFLMKFSHMANYLRWDDEGTFHHLCASLEGAAGQVL